MRRIIIGSLWKRKGMAIPMCRRTQQGEKIEIWKRISCIQTLHRKILSQHRNGNIFTQTLKGNLPRTKKLLSCCQNITFAIRHDSIPSCAKEREQEFNYLLLYDGNAWVLFLMSIHWKASLMGGAATSTFGIPTARGGGITKGGPVRFWHQATPIILVLWTA